MSTLHLGKLDCFDPLYEILCSQVCPDVKNPFFKVTKMSSGRVYKYKEEKTQVAIIGKFFNLNDTREDKILRIKGEYDNLQKLRNYGFDVFPHYVVRPISREESIGLALIEEFIRGRDLDHYLKKAIYEGKSKTLKDRLSRLASFLYALHARTRMNENAVLDQVSAYFQGILNKLYKQSVLSDYEKKKCEKLMDRWLNRSLLHEAKSVIVHGDATPTNFIFTEKGDVVAIDLERMKTADMVFDAGMVCGELKHAFLWGTGNPYAAEPFIRHFLKRYSSHFSDYEAAFREITFRNPFYMALTELRIARNSYLEWDYRKRLVHEAMQCLKWGLKLK